jgi:hypothetical protein
VPAHGPIVALLAAVAIAGAAGCSSDDDARAGHRALSLD